MCCLISSGGVLVSISFILRINIRSVYVEEVSNAASASAIERTCIMHPDVPLPWIESNEHVVPPMFLRYLRGLLNFEYLLQFREDILLIFVIGRFFRDEKHIR